jgi:hypothetical protein
VFSHLCYEVQYDCFNSRDGEYGKHLLDGTKKHLLGRQVP